MKTINTVLADDHRLFCEGLERVLTESGMFVVTGKFHNGQSLLENIHRVNADLLIVDVEMPLLNGFDAIKRIRVNNPSLKIAVLSMHEESVFSHEAFTLGANAYLNKSMESAALIDALLQACDGKKIFPSFSAVTKIESPFSDREYEVLKLIANGKTSEQIAERLHISHLTVKAHRRNMMRKLHVNNAAELISKALEMGFLYNVAKA
ncbi:MAG TPA: response regulator transcription factor [Chryseosolibacter sp.]|nr:response regulator transcription factor [Chryseosolibacter sp.]